MLASWIFILYLTKPIYLPIIHKKWINQNLCFKWLKMNIKSNLLKVIVSIFFVLRCRPSSLTCLITLSDSSSDYEMLCIEYLCIVYYKRMSVYVSGDRPGLMSGVISFKDAGRWRMASVNFNFMHKRDDEWTYFIQIRCTLLGND